MSASGIPQRRAGVRRRHVVAALATFLLTSCVSGHSPSLDSDAREPAPLAADLPSAPEVSPRETDPSRNSIALPPGSAEPPTQPRIALAIPDATSEAPPSTPTATPFASAASSRPYPPTTQRDEIDRLLETAVVEGYFPGAVVLISRGGDLVKHAAYGHSRLYESAKARLPDPIPARTDTIYDLASVSKLFTATYVMQLVEGGIVELDRSVSRYVPAFAEQGKAGVTVRQLLNHTSGLPAGLPIVNIPGTPAERLAVVDAVKPVAAPGARHLYSDLNYIVLGQMVEILSGQPLRDYAKSNVFGPLGMSDTAYGPLLDRRERLAATEYEPAVGRGMVWGETHDNSAWALGGAAGNAGIFATASDLARFAQAMLPDGRSDAAAILKPESVRAMTTVAPGSGPHGLGWEVNESWYMGALSSSNAWGHTGYTGTSVVVDAQRRIVVVLLANRVHPTARGPSPNPIRRALADAALRVFGR